jgi:hypothetical protein
MTFGVTGDFAANPDLDVLARGIEDGIRELRDAAERPRTRTAKAAKPAAQAASPASPGPERTSRPHTATASPGTKRTSGTRRTAAGDGKP